MGQRIKKGIRFAYVSSQWISVYCLFAGSILSLWDYNERKNHSRSDRLEEYLLSTIVSIVAATIFAYTVYKFKGGKIIEDASLTHKESMAIEYTYSQAPRVCKSNLLEAAYLLFIAVHTVSYNYLTIAGIKAYVVAYAYPNDIRPLFPLSAIGLTFVGLKTVFGDLPFNMSNDDYDAARQIKKNITGSKEGALISLLMKPLANKYAIFWITTVGTIVHTLWDLTSLILCIPPQVFINLHKKPTIFWATLSTGFMMIALLTINLIQTRYFSGQASERNLKALMSNERAPLHLSEKKETSFLHRLLTQWPKLIKPIRCGFYTQALLRAFSDLMPVLLLLRHLTLGKSSGFQAGAILPIAIAVFVFSTVGTHITEVRNNIFLYDKEFRFIGAKTEANNNIQVATYDRADAITF